MGSNRRDFSEALYSGTQWYKVKKYDEAISQFTVAISLNPAFKDAYLQRANAITHLDNKELYYQAIADYELYSLLLLREQARDYVKVRTNILSKQGVIYQTLGHYEAAIQRLTEAIGIEGIDPGVKRECIDLRESCYKEYAEKYKKEFDPVSLSGQKDSDAFSTVGKSDYWFLRGQRHGSEERIAESLMDYQVCIFIEKISTEPDRQKIRKATHGMVDALLALKQFKLAVDSLTAVIDRGGKVVDAADYIVRATARRGGKPLFAILQLPPQEFALIIADYCKAIELASFESDEKKIALEGLQWLLKSKEKSEILLALKTIQPTRWQLALLDICAYGNTQKPPHPLAERFWTPSPNNPFGSCDLKSGTLKEVVKEIEQLKQELRKEKTGDQEVQPVSGLGFFKPEEKPKPLEEKEKEVANVFYKQGIDHYGAKEFSLALGCFNTALALNPALTKVYLKRANAITHVKEPRDYYQAIADYDLHCLLNPGDGPGFMARIALYKAWRYGDLGCYDTAIRLINEAIAIEEKTDPDQFGKSIREECLTALADCKQKMKATTKKDEQEMQEIISPLLEEKNLKPYWDKANAHYKKNEYKQAIELCHAMIAFKPAYREAYHLRAECYLGLGKKAEAIADFHVFHALEKIAPSPKSQVALAGSHLGQAYYSVKQFDRAIALFTESIAQEKTRTTFRERAKAYAATDNLAFAIRDYCEAIALSFDKNELYKPKKGLEKLLEKKDPKKILDVLKTIEPLEDQLKILKICRDDAEHPLSKFFLESALFSMSGIINAIDAQIKAVEGELKKQKTETEQASTVRVHVSRKPGQGGS
ncbi:MAG TPA: hypothetical protein VLJ15_00655 [Gammaproteobacteria bacterium]|nr:hypothetical protein [Gammaproteobacteria bacterium]